MGGLVQIAAAVLAHSERKVAVSGHNIANVSTPGYKRRIDFTQVAGLQTATIGQVSAEQARTDFSPGKAVDTENPFDLAILGEGFFVVRSEAGLTSYTRNGQFRRGEDGRLLTLGGEAVQSSDGGDIVLEAGGFRVAGDGTILQAGEPLARLAVVTFADPGAVRRGETGGFMAPEGDVALIERPALRQGALEASNVSTGEEMVVLMEALRRAETGQRIMTTYDDLMGRALTAFGQA